MGLGRRNNKRNWQHLLLWDATWHGLRASVNQGWSSSNTRHGQVSLLALCVAKASESLRMRYILKKKNPPNYERWGFLFQKKRQAISCNVNWFHLFPQRLAVSEVLFGMWSIRPVNHGSFCAYLKSNCKRLSNFKKWCEEGQNWAIFPSFSSQSQLNSGACVIPSDVRSERGCEPREN